MGGFHTAVRGTMFVRNGAMTPGPSCECDITFFVQGRPKSAQHLRDSIVGVRGLQSVTVPSSQVTPKCRSLSGLTNKTLMVLRLFANNLNVKALVVC